MPFNNEIEELKAQIKMLQSKLSFLEELEKTKTPCEEAYKRWMGNYPPTGPSVDGIDDIRWRGFQMGYNASYEEKVSEEPQEPKTLYNKLEEWIEYGNFSQSKDVLVNEILNMVKEFIPEPMMCDDEDYDAGYNEAIGKMEEHLK